MKHKALHGKIIGGIAGAIAAVATVIFIFFPQLNPLATHSGDITEVQIVEFGSTSNTYAVRVHLEGFNDKPCPLRATLRNQVGGGAVLGFTDLPVVEFTPESQDDEATARVFVNYPSIAGSYYVEFMLYDDDGVTELDSLNSPAFAVQ